MACCIRFVGQVRHCTCPRPPFKGMHTGTPEQWQSDTRQSAPWSMGSAIPGPVLPRERKNMSLLRSSAIRKRSPCLLWSRGPAPQPGAVRHPQASHLTDYRACGAEIRFAYRRLGPTLGARGQPRTPPGILVSPNPAIQPCGVVYHSARRLPLLAHRDGGAQKAAGREPQEEPARLQFPFPLRYWMFEVGVVSAFAIVSPSSRCRGMSPWHHEGLRHDERMAQHLASWFLIHVQNTGIQ